MDNPFKRSKNCDKPAISDSNACQKRCSGPCVFQTPAIKASPGPIVLH